MKSQRSEARILEVGCQVRGRILSQLFRARVVSPCWVGAWSHGPELTLGDEDVLRASEKYLTREAAEGPAAVQQSVGRASAQIAWCQVNWVFTVNTSMQFAGVGSPCGGHPGRRCTGRRLRCLGCPREGTSFVACLGGPHEGGIPRKAVVAGASPRAWFRLYVSRGDV